MHHAVHLAQRLDDHPRGPVGLALLEVGPEVARLLLLGLLEPEALERDLLLGVERMLSSRNALLTASTATMS